MREYQQRTPAKWRGDLEDKLGYEQESWRRRMAVVASFISPKDKSIMDLGAGSMHLGNILPETCEYYPVDYRKTSDKTIVCDFNEKEFPQIKVDVICAVGILGYIKDPLWFLEKIMDSSRKCILTYKGREKYEGSMLYSQEIIDFMNQNGWCLTRRDRSLDEWTLIAAFEKITSEELTSVPGCTGCGACSNICPMDAITMDYSAEGYLVPFVDSDKCVHCEKCVITCPQLKKNIENNNSVTPVCYAVWASDQIRMQSSSGGFFSVLSTRIIEKGGSVFGAAWDEEFCCRIKEASEYNSLSAMRYSKYVQSRTDLTFRQVAERLKEGKTVAYFGCPCQIAGLNSYLHISGISEKEINNLITIDLVCFCAPSNMYFQKYLEEEFGLQNVKNVTFRDKTAGGWSPVSYRIELKDGSTLFPKGYEDPYQRAFHGVLARRDTCENCTYYQYPRQGDFTIGDFWGIDQNDMSWVDGKGASVVLANNKKAEAFLEEIKADFKRVEEVPLEWCMNKGNRIGTEARPSHPNKKYFEYLLKNKTFREAVDMSLNNKYDIGLVCMFNLNTGNNLTNLALYQALADRGYSVLMIPQPDENPFHIDGKQYEKTTRFLKNPYPEWALCKDYEEKWEYYELNDKCHMFMAGSDQLWRSVFLHEFDYFYLMDWVRGDKYKMSYSTSFGTESFEGDGYNRARTVFLLNRMNRVSVREKSGVSIFNEMTGREAACVLDPVFMCDSKVYDKMADTGRMRMSSKPYVGAYLLDITEDKRNILSSLSTKMTNDLYYAITDYPAPASLDLEIDLLDNPSIEEWLALIKNCDFFVTDSFHGICFSIIFKKQFCVTFKKDNWRGYDRIVNILEMFGLSDRMCADYSESELQRLIDNKINYVDVYEILNREKEISLGFLKDGIKDSFGFKGVHTEMDVSMEKEFYLKKEIRMMQQNMKKMKAEGVIRSLFSKETAMNEIVAFGSGTCFRRNIGKLKESYDIRYVCDNDLNKWDKTLDCEVMCISPIKLKEIKNPLVIIMVDDIGVSFDIARQLNEMGITNYTHVINVIRALEG